MEIKKENDEQVKGNKEPEETSCPRDEKIGQRETLVLAYALKRVSSLLLMCAPKFVPGSEAEETLAIARRSMNVVFKQEDGTVGKKD